MINIFNIIDIIKINNNIIIIRMTNHEIITRANNILSINCDELSSLSKIYFISTIKITIDLLNDENDDNDDNDIELITLINKLEILHTEFEKYYDWNGDFYFNDHNEIISKSFLTYITNNNHKYHSTSDIKIKCIIIEDFLKLYEFTKFKKINEKNKYIELDVIKSIYNEIKIMLNELCKIY